MKRAAALLALAAPASAQTDDPFAGIPGVTFSYYDVAGEDLPALRAALAAAQQVDPNDSAHVAAWTRWRFDWFVSGDGAGGCRLEAVTLRFAAEVRLPRLVGAPPDAVRAQWDRFLAATAQHEAGHVRHAWDRREAVRAAIRAATCATATAAGRGAIAALTSEDRAYDAATQHGAADGAEL